MNESSSKVGTTLKAECSQCGGQRNCDVRGHHPLPFSDEIFWALTDWYILQCKGCDHVFVQTDTIMSDDLYEYMEEDRIEHIAYNHHYKYWPALSKRAKPDWMGENGINGIGDVEALDQVLVELYGALNNDLPMLSAIGIRTCLDVASEVLGIDPALSFAEKLNSLVKDNRIRDVDLERLGAAVEAGNASAHRGWKPSPDDLATMMTILEHFIFDAFVQPSRRKQLDKDALKVKGTVPPRPLRKKKNEYLVTKDKTAAMPTKLRRKAKNVKKV